MDHQMIFESGKSPDGFKLFSVVFVLFKTTLKVHNITKGADINATLPYNASLLTRFGENKLTPGIHKQNTGLVATKYTM